MILLAPESPFLTSNVVRKGLLDAYKHGKIRGKFYTMPGNEQEGPSVNK